MIRRLGLAVLSLVVLALPVLAQEAKPDVAVSDEFAMRERVVAPSPAPTLPIDENGNVRVSAQVPTRNFLLIAGPVELSPFPWYSPEFEVSGYTSMLALVDLPADGYTVTCSLQIQLDSGWPWVQFDYLYASTLALPFDGCNFGARTCGEAAHQVRGKRARFICYAWGTEPLTLSQIYVHLQRD